VRTDLRLRTHLQLRPDLQLRHAVLVRPRLPFSTLKNPGGPPTCKLVGGPPLYPAQER